MSVVESAAEHGLAPLLDDAAPRTRGHPPIHRPSGRGVHRLDTCSQSAIRWAFEDACPFRLPRFAARFGTQSPVQDSGEQLLRPRLRRAGGSVPRPIPGVGGVAGAFVDASHYTSLLDLLEAGTVDRNTRDSLWAAWTTMMWLDGLSLYESAPYGIS